MASSFLLLFGCLFVAQSEDAKQQAAGVEATKAASALRGEQKHSDTNSAAVTQQTGLQPVESVGGPDQPLADFEVAMGQDKLKLMNVSVLTASVGCEHCCGPAGGCGAAFHGNPGHCCNTALIMCCPRGAECVGNSRCRWLPGHGPAGQPPVYRPPSPPAPPVYQPPVQQQPPANPNAIHPCLEDTGGTCRLFSCSKSRGATQCRDGKCVCSPGNCLVGGHCVADFCDMTTPGTCHIFGCKSSRGHTQCRHGRCMCVSGACSVDGVCSDVCPKDTGGTCRIFGCGSKYGQVDCVGGKCLCPPGHCNVNGRCRFVGSNYVELQPFVVDDVAPAMVTFACASLAALLASFFAMRFVLGIRRHDLQEPFLNSEDADS